MPKRPDIYIGLVAAAGTDLDPVKKQLKAQFSAIAYSCEEIKVSALIADFLSIDTKSLDEHTRIKKLMDGGDKIRRAADNGDGVVSLIIEKIRKIRGEGDQDRNGFKGSTLFIIDSLKNPSEITALDACYARNYYTISVYCPEKKRKSRLSNVISRSKKEKEAVSHADLAIELMKQDEGRKPTNLSQDVLGTFPKADFFLKNNTETEQIKRFVDLIFGNPFITPTQDEFFMNLARTASLRSADLSRQVGAVIVDSRGAVISQGYNEVPYPGGGAYFEGIETDDNRDHVKGGDPNQAGILDLLSDVLSNLKRAKIIDESIDPEQRSYELLYGDEKNFTSDSKIKNIIEFSRVVHAEMAAICEAARFGRPIDNATLYCTTFPCHGCARHIISSGISEVVFIEPYPKKLDYNPI